MTPADLRAWHDASGLSVGEAAKAIGISRRYYTYLLAGKTSTGANLDAIPRRIEMAWRTVARAVKKKIASLAKTRLTLRTECVSYPL